MSNRTTPKPVRRYALAGRVATMDDRGTVFERGVVYVDAPRIVAVAPAAAPRPAGFARAPLVPTNGTILPGLIELHNHLAYDILPPWPVPARYRNRDQWGRSAEYHARVTVPMRAVGRDPDLMPAVARYVECKCLLAGVTTTQGIALFSNQGARRFYRGLVRNVEAPGAADLPAARGRIADVAPAGAADLRARLDGPHCLLLHLAEGRDARARAHFRALRLPAGAWALGPRLAGIHCAALAPADFQVLGRHGAAMVWSPLSNLLLYGATAPIAAARAAGVRIALGSDWSPTGSKNLLGELKVARVVSRLQRAPLTDDDLAAMVTRVPADILGWHGRLGSLVPGAHADLLVLRGDGPPASVLVGAPEFEPLA